MYVLFTTLYLCTHSVQCLYHLIQYNLFMYSFSTHLKAKKVPLCPCTKYLMAVGKKGLQEAIGALRDNGQTVKVVCRGSLAPKKL